MSAIDLSWLQPVSWIAAAFGVCLAALYYAMNLRETSVNRRIALTTALLQPFMSEEGTKLWWDLMSMEWKDWDDFKKRYDSRVNSENFTKRFAFWSLCNNLGHLYKTNMIDLETIYYASNVKIQYTWEKFKPVIYELRKSDFGPSAMSEFEYLADALNAMQDRLDSVKNTTSRIDRVLSEHSTAKAQ
jgi:hypothetical protein